MKSLAVQFNEYSASHQHPINIKIHKICVPLIEWSLFGILYCLPRPVFFHTLTWAHVGVFFSLIFYFQFRNWKVILASLILLIPFWLYIKFDPPYILETCLAVFILAWIGQFWGHRIEGKRPSFYQDAFFLLVGPLWVVESILKPWGMSLTK